MTCTYIEEQYYHLKSETLKLNIWRGTGESSVQILAKVSSGGGRHLQINYVLWILAQGTGCIVDDFVTWHCPGPMVVGPIIGMGL